MMAEIEKGRGTIGGLMVDPSVYEDLKTILGNVKRNVLLKALIRFTINTGDIERPSQLVGGAFRKSRRERIRRCSASSGLDPPETQPPALPRSRPRAVTAFRRLTASPSAPDSARAHHALGHAAEQRVGRPLARVRADHDQVRRRLLGEAQQLLRRSTGTQVPAHRNASRRAARSC